jgi:hypothetical protein
LNSTYLHLLRRTAIARADILLDILIACGASACAGIFAVLFAQFLAVNVAALWLILAFTLLAVLAAVGICMAIRAFRRLQEAQNIRLGLRGEQAVAEVLHEAGDCGFRAFHDFPGGKGGKDWNIDHVAVGTRGVFLAAFSLASTRPVLILSVIDMPPH